MSVIILKELAGDSKLGVWKIEEDESTLLSKLQLSQKEEEFIKNVSSGKRYLHWLSSRVLLRELLDTKDFIDLNFDENGKPLLKNFDYNLSISHSEEMAAVIISKEGNVGIDIEFMDPKINRVAHKFMNREELDNLKEKDEIQQMYVYWCAKESLYKVYSKKKLRFREDLPIAPFKYNKHGVVHGQILNGTLLGEYDINYEQIDDYMLTYIIGMN